ncbi:hypothetical protein Ocin01_09307 [Orchesella cincta]|uniref:Uncharacterized protein n=1 Tax=Orchesella cincta TaxID=48709 RepID=A0A1D2MWN0_ORCCI|nr:hypothetical protein Ocin01_09307 [Orchesella cincta]
MGGINRNPIIGIVVTILFIGMGNCADNISASKVSTETGENQRNSAGPALFKPIKPKTPDCSNYFPGTPAWNECFRVFTSEMANFNTRMQEHMQKYKQEDGANGASIVTQFGPGYYSESHQNSHSTSNNYIGGYAITAENLPISTSIVNGVLKVTLRTGQLDKFDSKIEGQEIKLNALSQGQSKAVRIAIPTGISINDVKIDRTPDAIYITAPVKLGNGGNSNFQWSSTSGNGASSSSSFHNTGGEFNTGGGGGMPPIPDYSNMFGNMFQNIFGLAFGGRNFGGRAMQPQMAGYNNNPFPSYYTPQVWFY